MDFTKIKNSCSSKDAFREKKKTTTKLGQNILNMHMCIAATKKNKIMSSAATWMNCEGTMLSEIRKRQVLYVFTCIWNLKK